MTEPSPVLRRLAEMDARAAETADPRLQADVVCLVRLVTNLIAMHSPTADGRRCGECHPSRTPLLNRHRPKPPPTPCRTRWLLDVVIGR